MFAKNSLKLFGPYFLAFLISCLLLTACSDENAGSNSVVVNQKSRNEGIKIRLKNFEGSKPTEVSVQGHHFTVGELTRLNAKVAEERAAKDLEKIPLFTPEEKEAILQEELQAQEAQDYHEEPVAAESEDGETENFTDEESEVVVEGGTTEEILLESQDEESAVCEDSVEEEEQSAEEIASEEEVVPEDTSLGAEVAVEEEAVIEDEPIMRGSILSREITLKDDNTLEVILDPVKDHEIFPFAIERIVLQDAEGNLTQSIAVDRVVDDNFAIIELDYGAILEEQRAEEEAQAKLVSLSAKTDDSGQEMEEVKLKITDLPVAMDITLHVYGGNKHESLKFRASDSNYEYNSATQTAILTTMIKSGTSLFLYGITISDRSYIEGGSKLIFLESTLMKTISFSSFEYGQAQCVKLWIEDPGDTAVGHQYVYIRGHVLSSLSGEAYGSFSAVGSDYDNTKTDDGRVRTIFYYNCITRSNLDEIVITDIEYTKCKWHGEKLYWYYVDNAILIDKEEFENVEIASKTDFIGSIICEDVPFQPKKVILTLGDSENNTVESEQELGITYNKQEHNLRILFNILADDHWAVDLVYKRIKVLNIKIIDLEGNVYSYSPSRMEFVSWYDVDFVSFNSFLKRELVMLPPRTAFLFAL